MKRVLVLVLALLGGLLAAAAAEAYTVVMRDGSRIIAREPIQIEGDTAFIVLQSGTRTSIAASEIDLERTREANHSEIGSAVVIDAGVTELPSSALPRRETLADALRREAVLPAPSAVREEELEPIDPVTERPLDLRLLPREPYASPDLATEVRDLFRAKGIAEILVYQGTSPDRLLLDVTTNSEVIVFRSLAVAAETLLHLRERSPAPAAAFELVLQTSEREPAGQFLLTPQQAERLVGGEVELPAFFIEQVRF